MAGCTNDNLISVSAADRLITAHDGDVALLFLYIQRSGCRNMEKAADVLCRTRSEMDAAYEKLQRMGLLPDEQNAAPTRRDTVQKFSPDNELPEYRSEDIINRSREDPAFSAVVKEAQKVLGHALSSPDLKKLFGIYDYLALPPDVIMLLLNHCVDVSRGRDGMGRLPSMRFIEKEAYNWANREILTMERAEEYISRSQLRRDEAAAVSRELGIFGRKLTSTESNYIHSWLDMGFPLEVIAHAYDRTVTNTGALKWPYMNRILLSWKEKGLFSVSEIEEKDSRRKSAGPAVSAGKDKPIDMKELEKMLSEI